MFARATSFLGRGPVAADGMPLPRAGRAHRPPPDMPRPHVVRASLHLVDGGMHTTGDEQLGSQRPQWPWRSRFLSPHIAILATTKVPLIHDSDENGPKTIVGFRISRRDEGFRSCFCRREVDDISPARLLFALFGADIDMHSVHALPSPTTSRQMRTGPHWYTGPLVVRDDALRIHLADDRVRHLVDDAGLLR